MPWDGVRRVLVELEVMAEKGFAGLKHLLLHGAAAEAMAFAGEQVHLHGYALVAQGQGQPFALLRWHHPIV